MDEDSDMTQGGESARVAIVRRSYERFNNKDYPAVLEMLDPDAEIPNLAFNTIMQGHDSIEEMWHDQSAVAEHTVLPSEIIEMGDAVIAVVYHQLYDRDGSVLGPGLTAVHRFTFRGDRIARLEVTPLDEIPDDVLERFR